MKQPADDRAPRRSRVLGSCPRTRPSGRRRVPCCYAAPAGQVAVFVHSCSDIRGKRSVGTDVPAYRPERESAPRRRRRRNRSGRLTACLAILRCRRRKTLSRRRRSKPGGRPRGLAGGPSFTRALEQVLAPGEGWRVEVRKDDVTVFRLEIRIRMAARQVQVAENCCLAWWRMQPSETGLHARTGNFSEI